MVYYQYYIYQIVLVYSTNNVDIQSTGSTPLSYSASPWSYSPEIDMDDNLSYR